jgi:hypothetical protein
MSRRIAAPGSAPPTETSPQRAKWRTRVVTAAPAAVASVAPSASPAATSLSDVEDAQRAARYAVEDAWHAATDAFTAADRDARRGVIKAEMLRVLTHGGARPMYRPATAPVVVPDVVNDAAQREFYDVLRRGASNSAQAKLLVRDEQSSSAGVAERLRAKQRQAQAHALLK